MRSPLGSLLNRPPVPYVGPAARQSFIGSLLGRHDKTTEMAAMGSVGTLFSVVNRTSTSVALNDWHLCRKRKPGSDPSEPPEMVVTHPALDLWNRPNDFYTRHHLTEAFQQHVDLTGEGWLVIATDPRFPQIPLELWPVRPDRIRPVADPDEFMSGYIYTAPQGEEVPLGLEQVIRCVMPNPLDPYRGMGPVQSILVDLDSARYSAEWNRNFFVNGAEPGGIIQVPEELSDVEFRTMRDRWSEQHRGVSNAHRVAILERGQWVDRQFSMRDMQFAQLRDVSRQVIREAFGMHPQFVGAGDVGHSRAEAEAAELIYARWYVVPRLERIKGMLNSQLLPLLGAVGESVEFGYCSPVPDDEAGELAARQAQATTFQTLTAAGVHPDDAATVAGLPPMRMTQPPMGA